MTDTSTLWQPDWHLPAGVHAFVSTRLGGFSKGPWQQFNLGEHVGDDVAAVTANRELLQQQIAELAGLVDAPPVQWVRQVHGTQVLRTRAAVMQPAPEADAIHTGNTGIAIGVLTADCLPVLFCANDGHEIAVAHAGWRGLLEGVLENTLQSFTTLHVPGDGSRRAVPAPVRAWLGPAIGPCHFEVGDEVRVAFVARAAADDAEVTAAAFTAARQPGKWFADLYALARIRLRRAGVHDIAGEALCTNCHTDRFYSYRKEPITGRFATLILRTR